VGEEEGQLIQRCEVAVVVVVAAAALATVVQ